MQMHANDSSQLEFLLINTFLMVRGVRINRHQPANIRDIFLYEKWVKNCASLWKCVLMVEKDPFGVCNDRYTSAAFG